MKRSTESKDKKDFNFILICTIGILFLIVALGQYKFNLEIKKSFYDHTHPSYDTEMNKTRFDLDAVRMLALVIFDEVQKLKVQFQLLQQQAEFSHREDRNCLAKNLYFEARNQNFDANKAVVQVVHYRIKSPYYKNDICDVIYEPSQFSWVNDSYPNRPNLSNPVERLAWEKSVSLADQYMNNELISKFDPELSGVTMYHEKSIEPNWDWSKVQYIKTVDDHKFYKEKRHL